MPGFNREQQLVLSILIRLHRKKITLGSIPKLRYWSTSRLIHLVRLLRIAHTIHVGRNNYHPKFTVKGDDDTIFLQFAPGVLETHPIMFLDLAEEARRQDDAGYRLIIQ
jgi:exopolyphosphatase/guanosine-5'-triphosphate,3'-diphosphate pyrophosphatase